MNEEAAIAALTELEPATVWNLFAQICSVPRPSKGEGQIRAKLRSLAKGMGLTAQEDQAGNLIVNVAATPGCERAPLVVLQAHMDMVCVQDGSRDHDFERDPIRPRVRRDDGELVVVADGTTLGADNGMGLAMALAVAAGSGTVHGPLELLFTVDEEAGMSGAKALGPASLKGRRLLNLDSEEDDAIYIGCAGGCDSTLSWRLAAGPGEAHAVPLRIKVSGLRGGHSGSDIHENRGNAIKMLAETLRRATLNVKDLKLAAMNGGKFRNAIPSEAQATVVGSEESYSALCSAGDEVRRAAVTNSGEKTACVAVERLSRGAVEAAAGEADSSRLLDALIALPHGVLGMHPIIAGLVETSNNLAAVSSDLRNSGTGVEVSVSMMARSSSPSWLRATLGQIASIGRLSGASVSTGNEYPGWEPNLDSPLLGSCAHVYEELFRQPPRVAAIHAGLECGVIRDRVGDMDMVSFGPRIVGAHTPAERVFVSSVQKSWKFLLVLLTLLAKGR